MDILKQRFHLDENYDLHFEKQKKNTKKINHLCLKKCSDLLIKEIKPEEKECIKNCHTIILNHLLKNKLF